MDLHPDIRIDRASAAQPEELLAYLNELQSQPFAADPLGTITTFAAPASHTAALTEGWSPAASPLVMGNELPVTQPGWRRVWLARATDHQIVGHVDLRSHPVRFDVRRCLLSMAVRESQRRRGIGKLLLAHAERWAAATNVLRRIDLQIRPNNVVALALCRRAGYANSGEFTDLRFDGRGCARYVRMEKRVSDLQSMSST